VRRWLVVLAALALAGVAAFLLLRMLGVGQTGGSQEDIRPADRKKLEQILREEGH